MFDKPSESPLVPLPDCTRVHAAPTINGITAIHCIEITDWLRQVAIGPFAFIGETIKDFSRSEAQSSGPGRHVIEPYSAELSLDPGRCTYKTLAVTLETYDPTCSDPFMQSLLVIRPDECTTRCFLNPVRVPCLQPSKKISDLCAIHKGP
jgi:hypothetical protein